MDNDNRYGDPMEAFEWWARRHGFKDVIDAGDDYDEDEFEAALAAYDRSPDWESDEYWAQFETPVESVVETA